VLEGSVEIEIGAGRQTERLALLRERAAWWARTRTLFVADVHIGKPAAFRAWGAPVPEEVTRRDLARLASLVSELRPARLVVLGDLLHAAAGMTEETTAGLKAWRAEIGDVEVVLVRGNHDRKVAPGWGAELGVRELEPGEWLEGVRLLHDPADFDGCGPALAGHLHPGVALRPATGGKGAGLRAACFWASGGGDKLLLVLPAFGTFTGAMAIRAREGDRVFAVGPSRVIEVAGRPQ
jgi:DNA ligase-associated metallophosphoesterase